MRILIASILLLTTASSVAVAQSEADLSRTTADLQKQAVAKLGFGLRSIGLLLQARPNDVLRKAELVKNGDWPLLEQLQHKGLVKLEASAAPQDPPEMLWVSTATPMKTLAIARSAHLLIQQMR
jgi:hypothetical protein